MPRILNVLGSIGDQESNISFPIGHMGTCEPATGRFLSISGESEIKKKHHGT